MRKESFSAAQNQIKEYLYSDNLKAYTSFDMRSIFNKKRDDWKIASYRNQYHFTEFLKESNIITEVRLRQQNTAQQKQIFIEPGASNYDIGLTIKKDGYLSNYSAMQIHQLTLQFPKTIYVSYPKSEGHHFEKQDIIISQASIDNAFSKPQRLTTEIYRSDTDGNRYYFIQKAYSKDEIGIIEDNYRYTDLERTLIDIALRPAYSGGVFEVLTAFEIAKGRINLKKLSEYLQQLNYVYPYNQILGFYLEKAKYPVKQVNELFLTKIDFDFYLTYNMSNKQFDSKWRIYYPKGF